MSEIDFKHNPDKAKPFAVVRYFEEVIAEYCGSKYAVAVESGTAAIFLSLQFMKSKLGNIGKVYIPKFTYPSVPASIIHAGGEVAFYENNWQGTYELAPLGIFDSALRFKKGMYKGGFDCLSFHVKKHVPIGRGGMILTNSEEAVKWFKRARFDGRDETPLGEGELTLGWNMYMTPEQAVRGLQLFEVIRNKELEDLDSTKQGYPDLSKYEVYKKGGAE